MIQIRFFSRAVQLYDGRHTSGQRKDRSVDFPVRSWPLRCGQSADQRDTRRKQFHFTPSRLWLSSSQSNHQRCGDWPWYIVSFYMLYFPISIKFGCSKTFFYSIHHIFEWAVPYRNIKNAILIFFQGGLWGWVGFWPPRWLQVNTENTSMKNKCISH